MPVDVEYKVEPLVDLVALRDLSYVPVKGVYMTSYAAGSQERITQMLALADKTEINALVIDVKEDLGLVTYDADVGLAKELGLVEKRIPDIDELLATLAEHDIVPIARVVCFKDTKLAKARPDLAVQSTEGGMWADWKGLNYTNPYNHEVWEYIVQVAEDAARHGFREVQFDYVRFPTDGPISKASYPGKYCKMEDAIAGFLAYARARLEKLGVWVSADVFGLTVHTNDDGGFGQKIEKICQNVDIVCPMVYPSHYNDGSYGFAHPNSEPYGIVKAAMKDTNTKLAGTGAKGRPWLQDFSLGGVEYGVERVKAQIKAAEEEGFDEWILWDPALKYTEGALRPDPAGA
ncbi:MAG: putative glycoside hydrolase [Thermoleophilia bacterium]|nr:putative glycoside hydrolase [Thermoleophilia bacterium]